MILVAQCDDETNSNILKYRIHSRSLKQSASSFLLDSAARLKRYAIDSIFAAISDLAPRHWVKWADMHGTADTEAACVYSRVGHAHWSVVHLHACTRSDSSADDLYIQR